MTDLVFKPLLIATFLVIFWQDSKDRLVYWFLYPLIGIFAFIIEAGIIGLYPALVNSVFNLGLVSIIIAVGYFYSKTIMKKKFVDESMGTGDLLLFIFLSFTFATMAFMVAFVFSLIFSLLLHLYLKNKSIYKTVPLAGYISLFFAAIYLASFFSAPKYLFAL